MTPNFTKSQLVFAFLISSKDDSDNLSQSQINAMRVSAYNSLSTENELVDELKSILSTSTGQNAYLKTIYGIMQASKLNKNISIDKEQNALDLFIHCFNNINNDEEKNKIIKKYKKSNGLIFNYLNSLYEQILMQNIVRNTNNNTLK